MLSLRLRGTYLILGTPEEKVLLLGHISRGGGGEVSSLRPTQLRGSRQSLGFHDGFLLPELMNTN